jgi:hypothetical protein
MSKTTENECMENCKKKRRWNEMGNTVYCLGFIGAVFYYIQHATSFGDGLVGLIKAIVWPALVIFKLLGFLKM